MKIYSGHIPAIKAELVGYMEVADLTKVKNQKPAFIPATAISVMAQISNRINRKK